MRCQLAVAGLLVLTSSICAQLPATAPVLDGPVFNDAPRARPEDLLKGPARFEAEIKRRITELEDLQGRLVVRVKQVREEFLAVETPKANQEREAAKMALKQATESAIAPLRKDPAYLAAVQRREVARVRVAELREKDATSSTIAPAAQEAVAAANAVAEMEAKALRAEPRVAQARARVAKAESAIAQLKTLAEAAVKADGEVQELAQAVDDTRADIAAAYGDLSEAELQALIREGYREGEREAQRLQDRADSQSQVLIRNGQVVPRSPLERIAYSDTRNGKYVYQGWQPIILSGNSVISDPHQLLQRPFPFGQLPPREPPIWWDVRKVRPIPGPK